MAIKEGPALRVLKSEKMRAFCREFICTGGRGELAAKRAGYAGAIATLSKQTGAATYDDPPAPSSSRVVPD